MSQNKKITDPPTSVKEAIDWLIRIGECDAPTGRWPTHLPKSVKALIGGNGSLQDVDVKGLTQGLAAFIGWKKENNTNGTGGKNTYTATLGSDGIAKNSGSYTSAYKKFQAGDYDTYWVSCIHRKQNSKNKSCCTPPCKDCESKPNEECDPDGCCERCPKRICAKIFIAIIPCLYGVVKFLNEMCNGSGAWNSLKLNDDSELSKFFTYLGYDVKSQLNESVTGQTIHGLLNGNLEDKLKAVYEAIKEKYKSQNKSSAAPTTIRSMLQWMARMPATTTISQLKNGIDTKCQSLNNSPVLDMNSILPTLFATCAMSTFFLMGIERPDNMNTKEYFKELYVEESNGNADDCCKKLIEYIYPVHTQLRFLMTMCKLPRHNGGWKECYYANPSDPVVGNNITCGCLYSDPSCAFPLKHFLTDGNGNGQSNGKNKFKMYNGSDSKAEHYQMGFSDFSSTTPAASGSLPTLNGKYIYDLLKDIVDDIPTAPSPSSQSIPSKKPLSLLTQYCVAVGQLHPSSLGDLFAFFAHLGQSWENLKLYGDNGGTFNEKLKTELKNYQIGNDDQKACEQLKEKITAILNSEHSSHDSKKSLMSLMCATSTCTPYMKSLSQGVYHYYLPEVKHEQDKFHLLQYLYDMLRKLLDKMKELKGAFDNCECCKKGSCQGLIQCQYAHPILYKFGFVFGDPSKLNGSSKKKCTDIKTQLEVVLQCEQGSESALFSAFECVIQVTYSILLQRAKGCVTKKYPTNGNGNTPTGELKSTNQEMNDAFTLYVENAMYSSYPKLICTFACKVFDSGHDCKTNKCSEFKAPVIPPNPSSPSSITVSSSAVTTITAVIPQYTAPVIDPYHYKVFQKNNSQTGGLQPGQTSATYSFKDALDFHVSGAQCIRPTPVALRSVIDWILRVTTGAIATHEGKDNGDKNNNSNDNIKQLSNAIKSVFQNDGVSVTDDAEAVQQHVTALVEGLRTFMGYKDTSESVKTSVTTVLGKDDNNGNGVKGALKEKIDAIEKFIGENGKANFGTELGKALLKGRYDVNKIGAARHVIGLLTAVVDTLTGYNGPEKYVTFQDVVKTFTDILKAEHKNCRDLKCNSINNSASSKSDEQNDGLKILKDFLSAIVNFATYRDNINQGRESTVLYQLEKAERAVQGDNGNKEKMCPTYFSILLKALTDIGECYKKMSDLITPNGKINNSSDYRSKIDELKKALEKAIEELTEKDDDKTSKADVRCAVSAAAALIKKTKEKTDAEITERIKMGLKNHYDNHNKPNHKIIINEMIASVEGAVGSYMTQYQHHLDDLKQLCQWLYRMGQLYAHGLKGFVESLISHLGHIIQTIKWIEKLHKNLNSLNKEIEKYGTEDSIGFTRLSVRYIEDLLHRTYVLHELPQGTDQNNNDKQTVQARIQLLRDLRLLALDRYTLQVWQDECNKNAKDCRIRDWITFENGIIRHSNLEAVKRALHTLTGVAYDSNTAASTTTAYSLTNRIQNFHAICVIQKFSYQEPITRLERSLKELNKIQGQLSAVKVKCNAGTQELHTDPTVTSFSESVDKFLSDPYGVYSLAKFFHTIMGPNIFSAVIGSLEDVKSTNELNASEDKKKKFCGIVTTMCEGLEGENKNHYTLSNICEKLGAFILTLRREYIFAYPVVTCKAQQQAVAAQPQSKPQPLATTASPPSAQNILQQLKSVMLPCPSNFHNEASVCNSCYNIFAYILLGQVPKLYHSFKFMLWILDTRWTSEGYNKKITAYLVSMGFDNDKIQTGNQSPGAVNTQLHTTFKSAVEKFNKNPSTLPTTPPTTHHFPGLKEIHDKLEAYLKKLLQLQHEQALQAMLKSGTDTRRRPTTIREMLHWLSGVPFSVGYEDMKKFSKTLCDLTKALKEVQGKQELKHNIKPEPIEYRLGVSCAECLDVLQAVEDPLGKEPQKRYREYIATHDFYYPASASELFYMFVDIIYNVYVQMKFVCNMTGRPKEEGGWERCNFWAGKPLKGIENVSEDKIVCKCLPSGSPFTCQLACRRFLDGSNDSFFRPKYPLKFELNKIPNTSIKGAVIHDVIKHIFGSGNNYSVLCRLLLAVSSCPPTSIGDMISFLYWYRQTLFASTSTSGGKASDTQIANVYRNALHHEIELFPGTFKPSILTNALGALMSAHGAISRTTSGNKTHTHNMLSILDCYGTAEVKTQAQAQAQSLCQSASCAPYLRPLSFEVYKIYVPQFSRAYLSWILHFGPRVYTALEEIKGRLNGSCSHCSDTNNGSIVTCNAVLPELHSKGLDFYDPKVLNGWKKNQRDGSYQPNGGTKRGCNALITQLGEVLKPCNPKDPKSQAAPLHRLIEAIEQFLWSIRLPFSLVQLSLWSVAILFISYVFVVPLDHFKIKSHLFNRLKYTMHPSLLIADQQRRVSEVAYFSL